MSAQFSFETNRHTDCSVMVKKEIFITAEWSRLYFIRRERLSVPLYFSFTGFKVAL